MPKTTHNLTNTGIYNSYCAMKRRCLNPLDSSYKNYGARGIKIYKLWLDNFLNFYNWSIKNGYKTGLSIDRIDPNKNYNPKNCRWATTKQQSRNKRTNHNITFQGKTMCLTEWAENLGVKRQMLYSRFRRNWTIERALTEGIN